MINIQTSDRPNPANMASSQTTASPAPAQSASTPTTMRVKDFYYWQDAKALCPPSGTALTREVLQQPAVARHFGQVLAQHHNAAETKYDSFAPIKTVESIQRRWDKISEDPKVSSALSATNGLNMPALGKLIKQLSVNLQSASTTCIYTGYNWYPDTLCLKDDGTVVSAPDHKATGYQAWFEPLCRLDYTSRGSPESLKAFVDVYAETSSKSWDARAWLDDAMQCRQLFNIKYMFYFLDCADTPPSAGTEEGITKETALKNVKLLADRMLQDEAAMTHLDLPRLVVES